MLKQQKPENPVGAGKKQALWVTFGSRVKLEFHGSPVATEEMFSTGRKRALAARKSLKFILAKPIQMLKKTSSFKSFESSL